MKNLLWVTLLWCVLYQANSALLEECSIEKCQPLVDSLDNIMVNYLDDKPPSNVWNNMSKLCDKINECLTPIKCWKGKEYKEVYSGACLKYAVLDSNFKTECLPKIFTAAYNGKYKCSKKYDFLTRDNTKKRESFTSGKSCVLEIAQKECEKPAIDFLNKWYNEFVKALSTPHETPELCIGMHYELNKYQCTPLQNDLITKNAKLEEKVGPTHPSVLNLAKLCRETEKCMNQMCLFSDADINNVRGGCVILYIATSSFNTCLKKIHEEKPDLSKYKCLKGLDFYNGEKSTLCELFLKKSDCTKTIMQDICGKEVLNDYDETANILTKQLKCQ